MGKLEVLRDAHRRPGPRDSGAVGRADCAGAGGRGAQARAQRPIVDYAQERAVLDRARAAAAEVGLDPAVAESIIVSLIRASVSAQDRDSVRRASVGAGKTAVVVGGEGRMGRWFVQFLADQGYATGTLDVRASDEENAWARQALPSADLVDQRCPAGRDGRAVRRVGRASTIRRHCRHRQHQDAARRRDSTTAAGGRACRVAASHVRPVGGAAPRLRRGDLRHGRSSRAARSGAPVLHDHRARGAPAAGRTRPADGGRADAGARHRDRVRAGPARSSRPRSAAPRSARCAHSRRMWSAKARTCTSRFRRGTRTPRRHSPAWPPRSVACRPRYRTTTLKHSRH